MAILTVKKADSTTVPLPDPSEMSWSISDLDSDSSGRNQNGDLFRDRQAVKRKLTCSWPPCTTDVLSVLLNATEDEFFELTYPDPKEGKNRTMTAYVGDRTAPLYTVKNGVWLWENLEMNFVER